MFFFRKLVNVNWAIFSDLSINVSACFFFRCQDILSPPPLVKSKNKLIFSKYKKEKYKIFSWVDWIEVGTRNRRKERERSKKGQRLESKSQMYKEFLQRTKKTLARKFSYVFRNFVRAISHFFAKTMRNFLRKKICDNFTKKRNERNERNAKKLIFWRTKFVPRKMQIFAERFLHFAWTPKCTLTVTWNSLKI